MRHDVGDRFTMNSQRDTFTRAHRVDDAMRLIPQGPYTHFHVRHRSTCYDALLATLTHSR